MSTTGPGSELTMEKSWMMMTHQADKDHEKKEEERE